VSYDPAFLIRYLKLGIGTTGDILTTQCTSFCLKEIIYSDCISGLHLNDFISCTHYYGTKIKHNQL
jgi:hypothetical protein